MIKHYGSGWDMQTKGEFFTMFYFKEILRGSLLELAVLFRFGLSQIPQQLRLGNQAHAPTQPDFSGTTYVPTSSRTRRVKNCKQGTCKA